MCDWARLSYFFSLIFLAQSTHTLHQSVRPHLQYIPAACRNTRPSESNTEKHRSHKPVGLGLQSRTNSTKSMTVGAARLCANDVQWVNVNAAKLSPVPFRAWSLFWAIKLAGTKGNHILPCCLTDNSPLNDLLLGVNYANDAQTNSSRGQLRQPLISGQFPSCFTDIQLKNCLRTSALSGVWRSWRGAVRCRGGPLPRNCLMRPSYRSRRELSQPRPFLRPPTV